MALHGDHMGKFALLAWKDWAHDHLVDVSLLLKEHQKFHKVDTNGFLVGEEISSLFCLVIFDSPTLATYTFWHTYVRYLSIREIFVAPWLFKVILLRILMQNLLPLL
jgi:hypothetical protein